MTRPEQNFMQHDELLCSGITGLSILGYKPYEIVLELQRAKERMRRIEQQEHEAFAARICA